MARMLITGGAGFIGSHLAEALLARGHAVTILDDVSTGRLGNISHLLDNPAFRFERGSVLDAGNVEALAAGCDAIYHLAAAVGVRLIFERAIHTIETNVKGTEIVLEAALRHGRKVFVTSTSEVYGKDVSASHGKFRETDDITLGMSIRWCYACSKALDEYLARAYFREKGLPIVIGRFFNTVGPRQTGQYGMVIPRFVEQALQGRPLTVHGDGEQVRSFAWVEDTVEATIRLMETPAAVGEVFNIGNDEAISINDLARRVVTLTGSSSEIVHIPYEQAYGPDFEDIRSRVPDLTRLRHAIGYRPSLTIDAILERVIAHFVQAAGHGAPTGDGGGRTQ